MSLKKPPEILAPVGNWCNLDAALKAGADAIYFGIKGLNMRAGAKNFEAKDMKKIVNLCSKKGAKAYLVLNTIIFEKEFSKISSYIKKAKLAGVSAIICWDISVANEAAKQGVEVHFSTQASVSNSQSLAFFNQSLGVKRFVLARECSLEDIKKIKQNAQKITKSPIEVEVFAHGAMCVSISGRCFLSEYQYGKSANRGECLQPCRRKYKISDVEDNISYEIGSSYVLSPKDMCTIGFIDKLIENGVSSLKIEGRNRSCEYVYETVLAYKTAVNFYFENRKKTNFKEEFEKLKISLKENLQSVYNRGFSDGFYMGKPIKDWEVKSAGNLSSKKKVFLGEVAKFYPKISVAEIKLLAGNLKIGQTLQFEDDEFYMQEISSMQMDHGQITQANKGDIIAVKLDKKVKKNARVYIIKG